MDYIVHTKAPVEVTIDLDADSMVGHDLDPPGKVVRVEVDLNGDHLDISRITRRDGTPVADLELRHRIEKVYMDRQRWLLAPSTLTTRSTKPPE